MGAVEPSYNVPGDNPHWLAAVVDRARSNYEWFKNHPSSFSGPSVTNPLREKTLQPCKLSIKNTIRV